MQALSWLSWVAIARLAMVRQAHHDSHFSPPMIIPGDAGSFADYNLQDLINELDGESRN
jgi:hypothetical protein